MIKLKIHSIDHVAFGVADAERSIRFYAETLGLAPERLDRFRSGSVRFPSVRVNDETILDFFTPEYRGANSNSRSVDHVAFTLANSPRQIEAFLNERGIAIVREMRGNFGARGDTAHAFHVVDPDGNLLELHAYE